MSSARESPSRLEQRPFLSLNAEYYDTFPHADRTPLAPEILAVDVYDRLRTPYGLVRHGVAPDHASTKLVTRLFEAIEREPGFGYVLGVEVGKDLALAELREHYDAVVYAVGASADRSLGIPGEHLPGSLPATDVVGWYNGHPEQQDLDVPLDAVSNPSGRAVVVGNGNVALDVARILTADADALSGTDLAPGPLERLRASNVREVLVLGRRGPAQAAFTVPELIGLSGLTDVDVVVEADASLLTGDDRATRLLADLASRVPSAERRRIVLRFTSSPVEILGRDRVTGVRVARNRLVTGAGGAVRAEPTGDTEVIDAGLVVRSIGFRGLPVTDLPFDDQRGTVPNDHGRVEPGVYVVGWIKRGPVGFIGTNKSCAQETVSALLDDLDAGLRAPGAAGGIADVIAARCLDATDLAGWRRLDAEERARGTESGRPRLKVVDPDLQLLASRP